MVDSPWLLDESPWNTEAEFISWVRGGLRKLWSTHPVKLEYLKARKMKIDNPNAKTAKRFPKVNGYKCEVCNQHKLKVQVDHKSETGGTFKHIEDIENYAKYLYYVSFDDLQLACKDCHDAITHSQKRGVSFEEAKIEKEVIAIIKTEHLDTIKQFLYDYGYSTEQISTAKKRRSALIELFTNVSK